MPKISELPAAGALTGAETSAVVQGGVTKRATLTDIAALGAAGALGWFVVTDPAYGATGDGVTDDTGAINGALNAAGAAGGGVVYVPPGTYCIQPSALYPGTSGLFIQQDNITLMGAGPSLSIMHSRLFGGIEPSAPAGTPPPLTGGEVCRGHGIVLYGARSHIRIIGLQFDGGLDATGVAEPVPADPVTGLGWDFSHNGITLINDVVYEDILIQDCWVHRYRGGGISYLGDGLGKIRIIDCKVGDHDSDGISLTASDLEVRGCEIYDCTHAAIENAYITGRNVYNDNYIHDCPFHAMDILPCFDDTRTYTFVDIRDNHVFGPCGIGLYAPGARNMRVLNNTFVDCSNGISLDAPGSGGSATETISIENVHIFGNSINWDAVSSTTAGITLTANNPGTSSTANMLYIHDNKMTLTNQGFNNGIVARAGLEIVPTLSQTSYRDIRIADNHARLVYPAGRLSDDGFSELIDKLLADTSETTIVQVADSRNFLRTFDVFYEVVTAATVLTLKIKYTNASGSQVFNWIAAVSQPVGIYSLSYNLATGFSSVNSVQLTAQAGTANQITISARIRD